MPYRLVQSNPEQGVFRAIAHPNLSIGGYSRYGMGIALGYVGALMFGFAAWQIIKKGNKLGSGLVWNDGKQAFGHRHFLLFDDETASVAAAPELEKLEEMMENARNK